MKKSIFILLLSVFAMLAHAGVYKWTDAKGKVHYGDQPPPTQKKVVKLRGAVVSTPQTPTVASGAAPASAAQGSEGQKSKEDQAKVEEQKKQEKIKNCLNARSTLKTLNNYAKITKTDAAGRKIVLDDQQKAQEKERAQRTADIWCK